MDDASLAGLETEQTNPETADIDRWPIETVVRRLVDLQSKACHEAVSNAAPQIAAAASAASEQLRDPESKLVYSGAGTSGRLAGADAAELPPTYGFPSNRIVTLRPQNSEDETSLPRQAISEGDVVIGVAASGRTPFVVAALREARDLGALTIGISNNPRSELDSLADYPITLLTGPEPIAGSTRMSAGLAQKLALATLSTAVMVALGRTARNQMVFMQPTVGKLSHRAVLILERLTGLPTSRAEELLTSCDGRIAVSLLVHKTGCSAAFASERIDATNQDLCPIFDEIGRPGLPSDFPS